MNYVVAWTCNAQFLCETIIAPIMLFQVTGKDEACFIDLSSFDSAEVLQKLAC